MIPSHVYPFAAPESAMADWRRGNIERERRRIRRALAALVEMVASGTYRSDYVLAVLEDKRRGLLAELAALDGGR